MQRSLYVLCCTLLFLAAGCPLAPRAQTPALAGDGLRGEYYGDLRFEHLMHTRLDGLINFRWQGSQPIEGVAPENFTVRWTGYLVPPVSGRYVLHLAADDGVCLWLDGRQVLAEWRGQQLSYFTVPVQLQAGHPYAVQLDYLQYSQLARIHLAWELPQPPEVLHSWRTAWGLTEAPLVGGSHREETIPTQFLFSRFPAAHPRARARLVAPADRLAAAAPPRPMKLRLGEVLVRPPKSRTVATSAARRADTLAARLAKGQALTLRALYFEQGKADLPAPVQASLDTLAQALRRYPALRLEVQGHTDNQGDPELNRQLSQRRAEAVCRYLAERGVTPGRLQPLGLGGTQPVADNAQPAERPRNRRVVLRPLP